jgi:hypothetical protein
MWWLKERLRIKKTIDHVCGMYKDPQQDITSVQQFMYKDWDFDSRRIIVRLYTFRGKSRKTGVVSFY